jgi:AraC family transcriptional regulator
MPQHLHITLSKPLILAGRNGTFRIGPSPGIKNLWTTFMEDFGRIDGQVGFKAYGVCHNFDGQGNMDYMAAAEVRDAGAVPHYLRTLTIPEQRMAIYGHGGGVETLPQAWEALFKTILPKAGLLVAPGPQFEVYDFSDKDGPGSIEIHIPVA